MLKRALDAGVAAIEAGERSRERIEAAMAAVVSTEPRAQLDYVAAVSSPSLAQPEQLSGDVRLLIAARVGKARLIDNVGAHVR